MCRDGCALHGSKWIPWRTLSDLECAFENETTKRERAGDREHHTPGFVPERCVIGSSEACWSSSRSMMSSSAGMDGRRLADQATSVPSDERSVLAPDDPSGAPGTVAQAGVGPTLEGRALQDALRRAITTRRDYCSRDVDHAGWVVTLHSPEEQDFYGRSLEEALAWCLVWLMAPELGIGPFLV